MSEKITVLGVFVADTTYRAARLPRMGETVLGNSFALGPGGKGSNQAVGIGRLGGDVTLITRLGDDAFADLAESTWKAANVKNVAVRDSNSYTGAALVFVEEHSGDNAIIISPGAAGDISSEHINEHATLIQSSCVFMTQLEQPIPAATRALQIARDADVATLLNPAPATALNYEIFGLCDFLTPNETEASQLSGVPVETVDDARKAADQLLDFGVGAVVITLGEQGALFHSSDRSVHVPAIKAGPVVETTGAGDAFNAGFAVGLARKLDPLDAVKLGGATAGLSVARPGAAASMPTLAEVEQLLATN